MTINSGIFSWKWIHAWAYIKSNYSPIPGLITFMWGFNRYHIKKCICYWCDAIRQVGLSDLRRSSAVRQSQCSIYHLKFENNKLQNNNSLMFKKVHIWSRVDNFAKCVVNNVMVPNIRIVSDKPFLGGWWFLFCGHGMYDVADRDSSDVTDHQFISSDRKSVV